MFYQKVYTAEREISIYYEEASKDCRPRFESPLYQMELDANLTQSSSPKIVGQVTAASCGSEADIQVHIGLLLTLSKKLKSFLPNTP